MVEELCLFDEVKKGYEEVKNIIRDTSLKTRHSSGNYITGGGDNFYSLVLEGLSDRTRNTTKQIEYLKAFETALGLFRVASKELRRNMDVANLETRLHSQRSSLKEKRILNHHVYDEIYEKVLSLDVEISDAVQFSNRYALYVAGSVGLSLLGSDVSEIESGTTFGNDDKSKDRDYLSKILINGALSSLDVTLGKSGVKKEDDALKYVLENVFSSWVKQFNWNTWSDIAIKRGVSNLAIKYENLNVKDGEFKSYSTQVRIDEKFMNVRRNDVIGSEDFVDILEENLYRLAGFDQERQKNPLDPASVIFTYGAPGCGKTFTSHAVIQSFADFCKENGVPLWALTHSTTDYASEFQNKTANMLASLGQDIRDYPGIVLMYVADADNIFQSRKMKLTAEQQNTMSVYFKLYDGTLVPKNGKFLTIMDANYIDGIDDATKSRVFDEIVQLTRFTKPEHFAELARRSLFGGLEDKVLSEQDWIDVGDYILKSDLSNREIGHVLKRLKRGQRISKDLVLKSYEEKVAFRLDSLKQLSVNKIIREFENYIDTRMDIERKSLESKRQEDLARMLESLNQKHIETTSN